MIAQVAAAAKTGPLQTPSVPRYHTGCSISLAHDSERDEVLPEIRAKDGWRAASGELVVRWSNPSSQRSRSCSANLEARTEAAHTQTVRNGGHATPEARCVPTLQQHLSCPCLTPTGGKEVEIAKQLRD